MCRYKMTIGFPDLCNHPDFQIVTGICELCGFTNYLAGGSEQTWYLELSKVNESKTTNH